MPTHTQPQRARPMEQPKQGRPDADNTSEMRHRRWRARLRGDSPPPSVRWLSGAPGIARVPAGSPHPGCFAPFQPLGFAELLTKDHHNPAYARRFLPPALALMDALPVAHDAEWAGADVVCCLPPVAAVIVHVLCNRRTTRAALAETPPQLILCSDCGA